MRNVGSKKVIFMLLIGIFFILMGCLCNEWIVARFLAVGGRVHRPVDRTIIRMFDVCLVIIGMIIIRYRRLTMEQIKGFVKAYPRLSSLMFGILAAWILICSAEMFFFILLRVGNQAGNNVEMKKTEVRHLEGGSVEQVHSIKGSLFEYDELLGYKLKKNLRISVVLRSLDGRDICNVDYCTDEYGRRITPVDNMNHRDHYILFFGCSYTFGWGVKGDQTLPYYVGTLAPHYRPYNYGAGGYGTQQMLAKLQSGEVRREVGEANGMLIYVFLGEDTVRRAIGSMEYYNLWEWDFPYYAANGRGDLIRKGSLTTGRPLLSLCYGVLFHSQIAKYFNVNFPLTIGDSQFELTSRMIEEAHKCYQNEFGNENFYVLFYPSYPSCKRIVPYLRRAGIKYLDYAALIDMAKPGNLIELDGHPAPGVHKAIAWQIVKDLGIIAHGTGNK
jgi:hypothetical protein